MCVCVCVCCVALCLCICFFFVFSPRPCYSPASPPFFKKCITPLTQRVPLLLPVTQQTCVTSPDEHCLTGTLLLPNNRYCPSAHLHTDTDTQTQTHTQSQKANVWDGYVESRVRMSLDRGTAGKGESCEARGWRPSRAAWPVQMDRGSNKEGGQDEKIQNQRQFCVRVYACVRLSVSVRGLCLCSWHASHVHRGPPCVS